MRGLDSLKSYIRETSGEEKEHLGISGVSRKGSRFGGPKRYGETAAAAGATEVDFRASKVRGGRRRIQVTNFEIS